VAPNSAFATSTLSDSESEVAKIHNAQNCNYSSCCRMTARHLMPAIQTHSLGHSSKTSPCASCARASRDDHNGHAFHDNHNGHAFHACACASRCAHSAHSPHARSRRARSLRGRARSLRGRAHGPSHMRLPLPQLHPRPRRPTGSCRGCCLPAAGMRLPCGTDATQAAERTEGQMSQSKQGKGRESSRSLGELEPRQSQARNTGLEEQFGIDMQIWRLLRMTNPPYHPRSAHRQTSLVTGHTARGISPAFRCSFVFVKGFAADMNASVHYVAILESSWNTPSQLSRTA
jgi:hypothetical protein